MWPKSPGWHWVGVGSLQTSERLSPLYLIQRQIGASYNAYFNLYLSKKDGCIGNSVVCMVGSRF